MNMIFSNTLHPMNGLYNPRDDCGYRGDYRKHFPASQKNKDTRFPYMPGKVVALADKAAQEFPHFMDSGMPKLVQAKQLYLDANPNAVIMIHFAHNARIMELVRRMGIHKKVVPWQDPVAAKELVLVCRAPPIHPILWQRAGALLGVPNDIDDVVVGTKVIWVVRNPSKNALINGGICINDEQVQAYLRERFGGDFVSFDPSQHDLNETMDIFRQARVGKSLFELFSPWIPDFSFYFFTHFVCHVLSFRALFLARKSSWCAWWWFVQYTLHQRRLPLSS